MSEVAVIFIIRKILVPFIVLFCFYQVYRNKKVTYNIVFFYVFSLFIMFTRTFSFRHESYYDIIDKILILGLYPIGFLILSFLFYKGKNKDMTEKKYKYIASLVLLIIVEILFVIDIF
ncbi:MAG: hypothetical protein WDA24_07605 [Tissierellales bacterium]